MPRPALEVADILRDHGAAWRRANAGHVSLGQMKVMSAIERCRTAALGGHVARCENEKCAHTIIAYNSCRNRHCPKCQGAAAREWLAEREAELLRRVRDERRAASQRSVSHPSSPNRTCAFRYASGSPEGVAKSGVLIHPS
jgi:transposase-like zinc-binding protein